MRTLTSAAGAALLTLVTLGIAGATGAASAADLSRHHARHHSSHALGAYPDDTACQTFEPTEYEPRTVNFHQPLCYAARPYGISQHLYDDSTLLRHSHSDEDVY